MNNNNFDDIIKQKMQSLTPAGDRDVWADFEKKQQIKTDSSPASDDIAFDQLLTKKISHQKVSYNAHHWQLMKMHLKVIEERKNTVFVTKILEFAAIFLIVFTFFHVSDFIENENSDTPVLYANESSVDFKNNASNTTSPKIHNPKDMAEVRIKQRPDKVNQTAVLSENLTEFNVPQLRGLPIEASEVRTESESYTSLQTAVISNEEHAEADNQMQTKDLTEPVTDVSSNKTEYTEVLKSEKTKILLPIPPSPLSSIESEMALAFGMQMPEYKSTPRYSIGVYATGDVNLINTPFDKLYSLASYNKEALNNTYGLNISRQNNNVAIETGIGYAQRVYQPEKVTEAFGQFSDHYFEKSLNKISYDIATIPLNFKYYFINHSHWGAYLMAGATLNLITDARYDISETLRQGRPSPGLYTPSEARLDEKPFINGILNGDSFKNNYFASVGFGFGLEKKLFGSTSIYVQPSYQRHVLSADIGIGPNKDKIHTSSLQFGVKTVLN